MLVDTPSIDRANREFLERLLRQRAPWFKAKIEGFGWSTDVEFQPRLARRYGKERCWLAGDAAHQTGPAGMQSMNVGLIESRTIGEHPGGHTAEQRLHRNAGDLQRRVSPGMATVAGRGRHLKSPSQDRSMAPRTPRTNRVLPAGLGPGFNGVTQPTAGGITLAARHSRKSEARTREFVAASEHIFQQWNTNEARRPAANRGWSGNSHPLTLWFNARNLCFTLPCLLVFE